MHPCRGVIAWRAILSDESDESDRSDGANDTGCVPRGDPPACRSRRGRCTGLGSSGWGAVNSFTGIRFF